MRLINADKFEVYTCVNKSTDYVEGVQSVLEAIDAAPTVDAVEVVRCKGCEYSYESIGYIICSHGVCSECIVQPDFYCAEGKRRDENDDQ